MSTLAFLLLISLSPAQAEESDMVAHLQSGGHVLMLRHAYAPGTGDPAHFRIEDCGTQRNLNDQGRAQAAAIGDWLRERGIRQAQVFSSQWCRCLETAEGLDLGPVTPLPALNSFFQRPEDRAPNLKALRGFLARQPRDGDLIILVTHFVTIAGITGQSVSSGEGVVLKLTEEGDYRTEGRLSFDW
jgi:hypothetical protein